MFFSRKDQHRWRKWFAWYPMRIDSNGNYVWLEMIERRRPEGWNMCWTLGSWEGRLPGSSQYAQTFGYGHGKIYDC